MMKKTKIKKVIYIHGYNSSGETGETFKRLLKGKYEVLAPKIPQDAVEAEKLITKLEKENPDAIFVGTSLGAFVTLLTRSRLKIVINPTLHPSVSLPKIGCSSDIANSYKYFEDKLYYYLDGEDAVSTYGFFGTNDTVVNYKKEFENKYLKSQTFQIPEGEHRIKENEIIKYIIPLIDKLAEAEFNESYNYIDTLYIPED